MACRSNKVRPRPAPAAPTATADSARAYGLAYWLDLADGLPDGLAYGLTYGHASAMLPADGFAYPQALRSPGKQSAPAAVPCGLSTATVDDPACALAPVEE